MDCLLSVCSLYHSDMRWCTHRSSGKFKLLEILYLCKLPLDLPAHHIGGSRKKLDIWASIQAYREQE